VHNGKHTHKSQKDKKWAEEANYNTDDLGVAAIYREYDKGTHNLYMSKNKHSIGIDF